MHLNYDQGVPVVFVVRLGRPRNASDTLMVLCFYTAEHHERITSVARTPQSYNERNRHALVIVSVHVDWLGHIESAKQTQ